jgi:hypothetical protein
MMLARPQPILGRAPISLAPVGKRGAASLRVLHRGASNWLHARLAQGTANRGRREVAGAIPTRDLMHQAFW